MRNCVKLLLACLPAERFIAKGLFGMTSTASDALELADEGKVEYVDEKNEVYKFKVTGKTGVHEVYVSVPSRTIERHLNTGTSDEKILRSRRIESKLELAVLVCALKEYYSRAAK